MVVRNSVFRSAEICALVTEDPQTFRALKAPVRRVCALEAPIPYTPVLESHVFPNRDRIASSGVRGGDGHVTQARSAFRVLDHLLAGKHRLKNGNGTA